MSFDRRFKYYYDTSLKSSYEEIMNGTDNIGDTETESFEIGQTWTVDGQWELTVDAVTEISDRNEFSDKNPNAVYIIDYTYKNIGYEDETGFMNGLYISLDTGAIVDNGGIMGYAYPGHFEYYPQETPVGAICKAQTCIGVENPGDFDIKFTMYDSIGKSRSATFKLSVE